MCLMSSHPKVPIAEETPKYRNVFMKSNVQSFPAWIYTYVILGSYSSGHFPPRDARGYNLCCIATTTPTLGPNTREMTSFLITHF